MEIGAVAGFDVARALGVAVAPALNGLVLLHRRDHVLIDGLRLIHRRRLAARDVVGEFLDPRRDRHHLVGAQRATHLTPGWNRIRYALRRNRAACRTET